MWSFSCEKIQTACLYVANQFHANTLEVWHEYINAMIKTALTSQIVFESKFKSANHDLNQYRLSALLQLHLHIST